MISKPIERANKTALSKKLKHLSKIEKETRWIYMYDFRGNLKGKFRDLNQAANKLNKTAASISNYIKKENRFDGIHFLCRSKV